MRHPLRFCFPWGSRWAAASLIHSSFVWRRRQYEKAHVFWTYADTQLTLPRCFKLQHFCLRAFVSVFLWDKDAKCSQIPFISVLRHCGGMFCVKGGLVASHQFPIAFLRPSAWSTSTCANFVGASEIIRVNKNKWKPKCKQAKQFTIESDPNKLQDNGKSLRGFLKPFFYLFGRGFKNDRSWF